MADTPVLVVLPDAELSEIGSRTNTFRLRFTMQRYDWSLEQLLEDGWKLGPRSTAE